MKNKRLLSIILAAVTIVMSMSLFVGCAEKASDYTEKEHIARVTQLARKRYIDNGEFTDLEVFPLYDENDKLGYFLIELQPTGYVYVKLNNKQSLNGCSLYTRNQFDSTSDKMSFAWFYNKVDKEIDYTSYKDEHGREWRWVHRRAIEIDEKGAPIIHTDSVYKVMKINNEKRYLLRIKQGGSYSYIACVKRGNNFLNLLSLEEFVFSSKFEEESLADIPLGFNYDSSFNL